MTSEEVDSLISIYILWQGGLLRKALPLPNHDPDLEWNVYAINAISGIVNGIIRARALANLTQASPQARLWGGVDLFKWRRADHQMLVDDGTVWN